MYAKANGYFWLPCPNCGSYFGGHEWLPDKEHKSSIPVLNEEQPEMGEKGESICPACTLDGVGDRAWAEWYETHPRKVYFLDLDK
jgi:hypothetical protein